MEANQSGNPAAAPYCGLIPSHFARISIRQAKEAGGMWAERRGIRVFPHPINHNLEFIYDWPADGALLMVVDELFECAWADPVMLK